jgi:hypothetical protein
MTIVTPSFNMLGYLKRCCASTADQVGPTYEHIVVEGECFDPVLSGTGDWEFVPRVLRKRSLA